MPGAAGQITSSHPGGGAAGNGTGWAREIPLGPPPGVRWLDRQVDAQDARDKAERLQQAAQVEAAAKLAEQTEAMRQQTEAIGKLVKEQKK